MIPACAAAASSKRTRDNENPTARIPVDFRKSRRETVLSIAAALALAALCSARRRRALNGANDSNVRPAAAQIAVQCAPDLCWGWPLVLGKECRAGHDHPIDAVGTLSGLFFNEGLLHWMRLVRCAESFNCGDGAAGGRGERRRARPDGAAVDVHHAGTALTQPAAELPAGEAEGGAQHVEQPRVGRRRDVVGSAVDDDADRGLHVIESYTPRALVVDHGGGGGRWAMGDRRCPAPRRPA